MTALNHALAYAALRFKVIPLWWVKDGACACGNAGCGRNTGKHPIAELAPNGARSATSSTQTVRAWWEAYPLASIGITLEDLLVLDVDPRNGGTVEALPDGWQGTLHAATGGGGTHAVYRNPTGRKVSSPAKGIDIKAGGGAYVVVEPSVHLSGSAYSWVDWYPLDGDAPEIHELPRAWADAHIVKEPAAAAADAGGLPAAWDARQEFQGLSPGRRRIIIEGVPDGQRSDAFHGLVCGLTDDGLSAAQIEAVLRLAPTGIAAKYLDGADRLTEEIARCIAKRVEPEHIWPEPQPLTARVEPEDYPLDALPSAIQQAVQEVAGFVKAPIAMVASSALAAVSLATQAHADVKRADKLHGPVGLFLLVIADSGERKSTCDGFFAKPIRDYEAAQAEAGKPLQTDHKAALEAWDAKRGGIKEKIRQLAKHGKSTAGMESTLRDLEYDKPQPPRIPRLLYADATPEALSFGLAKQWPSGGVVSAEAGIVFGGHAMGKDSVMRNLAQLNQLWDGASLSIERRSTESFTVRGARLTMALQVQEPTLREYIARSGALARGTGFLARFLVAWPASTQGQRPFSEPPANWPHLAAFHRRITAILDQPAPIDEDGALSPSMLPMSPQAKSSWVEYHDTIEGELSRGGELYDVRDVASKSADNAARLAALFHMFEGGGGAIGADAFEGASRIAAWHLSEARRFFGELALPAELADAARLDAWLIEHCRKGQAHSVGKNYVRQHGPIRAGVRLDAAICELAELERLRLVKDGKRLTIELNPALATEGDASCRSRT